MHNSECNRTIALNGVHKNNFLCVFHFVLIIGPIRGILRILFTDKIMSRIELLRSFVYSLDLLLCRRNRRGEKDIKNIHDRKHALKMNKLKKDIFKLKRNYRHRFDCGNASQ